MRNTKIIYWISTVLFGGFMIFSGFPNLIKEQESLKFIHDILGYPLYIIPFLGLAKVLGGLIIIAPLPASVRGVKEWAYAGLFFDLLGAVYSIHMVIGWDITGLIMMPVIFAVGIISFITHRKLK